MTAVFARNFGAYFLLTALSIILFLNYRLSTRGFIYPALSCSLGIVIGYLPIIAMVVFIAGFSTSFLESVSLIFTPHAPTLPKPIPWTKSPTVSWLYLAIPAIYVLAIALSHKTKASDKTTALLLASSFVGIPVIHHIVTRADIAHLAQGISPFIISLLLLPLAFKTQPNKTIVYLVSIATIISTTYLVARYQAISIANKLTASSYAKARYVPYEVNTEILWIPKAQANYIDLIKELVTTHELHGENTWLAPFTPGLYPILGKPIPIWDPYPLFPASDEAQNKIIHDLLSNKVNLVLIDDKALDGMDNRRFSHTHPIVWRYLMDNFVELSDSRLPKEQHLLRRRES